MHQRSCVQSTDSTLPVTPIPCINGRLHCLLGKRVFSPICGSSRPKPASFASARTSPGDQRSGRAHSLFHATSPGKQLHAPADAQQRLRYGLCKVWITFMPAARLVHRMLWAVPTPGSSSLSAGFNTTPGSRLTAGFIRRERAMADFTELRLAQPVSRITSVLITAPLSTLGRASPSKRVMAWRRARPKALNRPSTRSVIVYYPR